MGSKSSKGSPKVDTNTETKETTTPPPQNACKEYSFNSTGCEITIHGKLLLVLDTINSTLQTYFSCFCEIVISRLNNTNVTLEVLTGANISTCFTKENPMNVDRNLLRNKLTNLSSEFNEKDNEAGMAIILSDQGLTTENFTDIPEDTEPFLFFVNVGQNESESGSCFRQNRVISQKEKINDFGLEMESIGCESGKAYMQESCPQFSTTKSPSTDSSQAVGMPLVILSVVGALVIAVLIIMYLVLRPKCQKQGQSKRNKLMESSVVGSEFVSRYTLHQNNESRVSSKSNDLYNELWEKERQETHEDNYHHIDMNFVKEKVDSSLYDVVNGIREDFDKVFKPPD